MDKSTEKNFLSKFKELNSENKKYIIAIQQALVFAQEREKDPNEKKASWAGFLPAQRKGQSMDVNNPKWFRSMGAEKLMEAEEREVKMLVGMNLTDREKNDLMFGKLLEAVPNDTVVVDKKTGEKMILLNLTATDEEDYYIAVNKYGELSSGRKCDITVLLTDEQKRLLE